MDKRLPKLLEGKIALTCFLALISGIVMIVHLWDTYQQAAQYRKSGIEFVEAGAKFSRLQHNLCELAQPSHSGNATGVNVDSQFEHNASFLYDLKAVATTEESTRLNRALTDLRGDIGQLAIDRRRGDLLELISISDAIWSRRQELMLEQIKRNMETANTRVAVRTAITCLLLAVILYLGHLVRFYIDSRNKAETELTAAQASLRVANAQLERLAHIDTLTDVLNRRGLERVLSIEISRGNRTNASLAAVFIDCDNFKSINELYGHAGGDLVLRAAAERMAANVRATDAVARIGGDEFVLLLPDTDSATAWALAERIRKAICSETVETPSGPASFSVSLAVAQVPTDLKTIEDLLRLTANAIHHSKESGKNQVSMI